LVGPPAKLGPSLGQRKGKHHGIFRGPPFVLVIALSSPGLFEPELLIKPERRDIVFAYLEVEPAHLGLSDGAG
jgi:hypothetical protein